MQKPDAPAVWIPIAMKVAAHGLAWLSIGPQFSVMLPPATRDFVVANEPRMLWPDRQ